MLDVQYNRNHLQQEKASDGNEQENKPRVVQCHECVVVQPTYLELKFVTREFIKKLALQPSIRLKWPLKPR
jgi:hypothetical protein